MIERCHTIGASDSPLSRLQGAVAFLVVWGLGQFVGPLSPLLLAWSACYLPALVVVALASAMAYPFLVRPESLYSPRWCRFVLSQAGWLKGGATLWATDKVMTLADRINEGVMVAYHPHGLIPCGFCLNGAVRARAQEPSALPAWLPLKPVVSGVQAPVLFRVPLLRHILLAFGCCVPATKARVRRLLADRTTFGIIPGGSEEVAIHQPGRENIYLKKRAGFLKYALQEGYTVVIAFTFGESDLYSSLSLLRPLNLALVRRFGFVLPLFWGTWFCPLLPRRDVALNTVFGDALELPRIPEPTAEQVAQYHEQYMAALEAVFEEHKAQFGYADRKLTFF